MPRQQIRAVLDAGLTFNQRFEQIAHDRQDQQQQQHRDREQRENAAHLIEHKRIDQNTHRGTRYTFPGFTRANGWRKLALTKLLTRKISPDIRDPGHGHGRQQ